MSPGKYTFDPEKLQYEHLDNNLKRRLLRISAYVLASLFVALVFLILYSFLFDTPREREVRQENEALSQDYEILYEKYERIDTVLQELKNIDENIYRTIFETEPMGGHTSREMVEDFTALVRMPVRTIVDSTASELFSTIGKIRQ